MSAKADAERFVQTKLPPSGLVRVLAAEAGEQRFEIRAPAHVVSADVIQAERGFRGDADEQRTLALQHLELDSEAYDVVLCTLSKPADGVRVSPASKPGRTQA